MCFFLATHFRFGTVSWKIPDTTKPTTVQFTFTYIFRATYFSEAPYYEPPIVGNALPNDPQFNFGGMKQITMRE